MQFRLSTLLLSTVCTALAIGWYVDRHTHRVPGYAERLAEHARFAAAIADVQRLHQFSDYPQAYTTRVQDVLFTTFLNLYRDRKLFSRTYGTIGGVRVNEATLRRLGDETLRRIDIKTLSEFEAKLAASGLGAPDYYDVYTFDGSLKPEFKAFVSDCLSIENESAIPSNAGESSREPENASKRF